jgi:hypothetical protein
MDVFVLLEVHMYRVLFLAMLVVGCKASCDDSSAALREYVDANRACAADSDCATRSCGPLAVNHAADPNTCSKLWSQVTDSCDYPTGSPACVAVCDEDAGVCIC